MKRTPILISIFLAGTFILFAAWAKLTHKPYADDALTVGVILQTSFFVIGIIWLIMGLRKRKVNI